MTVTGWLAIVSLLGLAVIGWLSWWRGRQDQSKLGKSAIDLAKQNAARAKEQATAEAGAARAKAEAAISKNDADAKESQDAAARSGSGGLIDRIKSGG